MEPIWKIGSKKFLRLRAAAKWAKKQMPEANRILNNIPNVGSLHESANRTKDFLEGIIANFDRQMYYSTPLDGKTWSGKDR